MSAGALFNIVQYCLCYLYCLLSLCSMPFPSNAGGGVVVCCRQCPTCPIVQPVFLCGSDNRTYSSLCRLHFHNCIHTAAVHVACKGFCPCKGKCAMTQPRPATNQTYFHPSLSPATPPQRPPAIPITLTPPTNPPTPSSFPPMPLHRPHPTASSLPPQHSASPRPQEDCTARRGTQVNERGWVKAYVREIKAELMTEFLII